jgi:hypothetical protein
MEPEALILEAPLLEPVKLTENQIQIILDEIPTPPGIGKTALRIAHQHLLDRVRTLLDDIKLVPVPEAYEEFKDTIIGEIYQSHIEPGTSVGITAGVSLGGPVTQLSLNSFHFAGAQSGVALAFQKVRDFLTGSKMNRSPQMKIYFKVPYVGSDLHEIQHIGTFDSIMAMRPELEQTLVSDVITDMGSRILTREEAELAGVPQMIAFHSKIRPERFRDIASKFPLSFVVELQLKTFRMYTHKITMAMVARAIEGSHQAVPPDSLTCVWKSQIDGKMYILVDESRDYDLKATNQKQDVAVLMFLTRYVMKQYDMWKISGISDIINIEPQEINVVKGIYRIKDVNSSHYIYTNNRKTRWDGISLADIHRLFLDAGFNVRPIDDASKEELCVIVDGYEGNANDLRRALDERIKEAQTKSEKNRTPEDWTIVRAATFHYALTNGTNMEEIVWRDDIDLFRTASNYSHEILAMVGIDAARIFLILRFMQTLADFSSYINPRHISLIFDLLCNLGIINSLSFVGINRRRIGPLAMASYERSMDVFLNASTFGDREIISGVSPSIYLGQRPKGGGTSSIALEADLTVIPRDRPALTSVDEDENWDDLVLDRRAIEGTKLTDVIDSEAEKQVQPFIKIIPRSTTLISALQKVITGPIQILEEPPVINPPPIIRMPRIPTTTAESTMTSYMNLLPDVSLNTTPTTQNVVPSVNVDGFMNQLSDIPKF